MMEERDKQKETLPADTWSRDRGELSQPSSELLTMIRLGEKLSATLRDAILNFGADDHTREIRSTAQELLEVISCLSDSPDKISRFPRLLHAFELAVRGIEESSESEAVQTCVQEANKLVTQILSNTADYLISTSDVTVQQPFQVIGAGSFNWVLSDKSNVLLISKGLDEEPFKAYRLRQLAASLMNQAGLDQPAVSTIRAEPFPHMIMEFGKGRSLYECISEGSDLENREAALSALARFLRQCVDINLPGYGQLSEVDGQATCTSKTKKEGLQWLVRRFHSPNESERQIDQAFSKLDLLPESVLDTLKECADQIAAFDEPSMLINGDPNPSNFLYDQDNDHIVALDLDMAYVSSPSEYFGLLYQSWVLHGLTTEANYFRVLEKYEPDPERQRTLHKQALSVAAAFSYIHAHNIYTRDDTRKTAALRETPEKFLRFTQIALEKKLAA
jgi:aminoglycoside phosphotransferase (APT) family kinase protein